MSPPELQHLALNFLATFLVVTQRANNRHTVSVIFYSCSFHPLRSPDPPLTPLQWVHLHPQGGEKN